MTVPTPPLPPQIIPPVTKDALRTTEFWTTIFVHLITVTSFVCAVFGVKFDGSRWSVLVPVAALIASGIAQAYYSHSRAVTKASDQRATLEYLKTVVAQQHDTLVSLQRAA